MSKIHVDVEIKDTILEMVIRQRLQKGSKDQNPHKWRKKGVSTSGTCIQVSMTT